MAAGTREFFMNEKKNTKNYFKKEIIKSENFLDNKKTTCFRYSFFQAGKACNGNGKIFNNFFFLSFFISLFHLYKVYFKTLFI